MENNFVITVLRYIEPLIKDPKHRFKSWEHCFFAFGNEKLDTETKALQLAFYLASWGMYRGSSGLLWKDYTIHVPSIEIVQNYQVLRSDKLSPSFDVLMLLECINELCIYYGNIPYLKGKITPTQTLISKIILGTLGCLPAFDRYFYFGYLSFEKPIYNFFSRDFLESLIATVNRLEGEINKVQSEIRNKTGIKYTPMKIFDMYCWQIGYEKLNQK